MAQVNEWIRFLLIEPFTWTFYCFFQPMRFKREIEVPEKRQRFLRMCRLVVPCFLFTYPFALITRIAFAYLFPHIYADYFSCLPSSFPSSVKLVGEQFHCLSPNAHLQFNLSQFAFDATWAAFLALGGAVLIGSISGLAYGIAGGIAGTFWVITVIQMHLGSRDVLIFSILPAFIVGIIIGVAIGSARDIARSSRVGTGIGNAVGILVGIPVGILLGVLAGSLGGSAAYAWLPRPFYSSFIGSITSTILGTVFGVFFSAVVQGVVRGSLGRYTMNAGLEQGFSLGIAVCVTASVLVGGTMGTAFGDNAHTGLMDGLTSLILPNLSIVLVCFIAYMLGYYRLPLYLLSGLSSLRVYLASRKNPPLVFSYLHRSSLYWDECVFLPLPGLKRSLHLAIDQDTHNTLAEIAFIAAERPTQMTKARSAMLEIVLRDLEERDTLRHIAQASDRLAEILRREDGLIDPRWVTPFSRLNDTSREATRYGLPMDRQSKQNALDEMILNLKRVRRIVFDDQTLNRRLQIIVENWLSLARQELDKLELAQEQLKRIDNPYISGAPLKLHNQQFVGRHDLVKRLEGALKEGAHCSCFFLIGERHMGKTSTLNRLPQLLSTRYIPLTFDLQSPATLANVAALLFEIADGIRKEMGARGMRVPRMRYNSLNEARRENEPTAYRLFERWLKEVEDLLEREDRMLLIAFDEFEKLEEAGLAYYLDFRLLLDWFRSIIRNHSRLALLFSGIRTLREMETEWSSYLVNIKMLRVSFLHPADARHLITQPVPGYPSEQIFGEGVVEEIVRVTGCHPFLVQAVCEELINILNADRRDRAHIGDVGTAVETVLESWGETYFRDLWSRTSQEQRVCLATLKRLGKSTAQQISEYCSLEERVVQLTLQVLLKRDLARIEQGVYQIATPIFNAWLEGIS